MANIKIAIVDDHQIVRDGIKILIEDEPGFEISFEAENGEQATRLSKEHKPDLIIMDITMPKMNGIEATEQIKKEQPDVKVLALTMLSEDQHIKKMIKAGASGYILKSSGKKELIKAINTILDGKHYFSDDATQAILQELVEPSVSKNREANEVNITERELEVLKLIVNECTNQEIADQLFVSVRTVDAHRRNLLQKTGAKNTAGLVKYAIKNQLFENNGE
ncbi:MAG: response regulator transcription factor [Gracilimonas sp.]|uniref:response regulator transcription factor n=1 Tax=Gracilimonas TaxID=649462 RepID=UPI001B1E8F8F|nr:response regulator transcription factor [Gracilimonas sp.]MBO6584568.1 response regulator transcription factor [Gracilimonas sp.]MBO6616161.1 response regulator transcription factor [Gracilimonas sp.]